MRVESPRSLGARLRLGVLTLTLPSPWEGEVETTKTAHDGRCSRLWLQSEILCFALRSGFAEQGKT